MNPIYSQIHELPQDHEDQVLARVREEEQDSGFHVSRHDDLTWRPGFGLVCDGRYIQEMVSYESLFHGGPVPCAVRPAVGPDGEMYSIYPMVDEGHGGYLAWSWVEMAHKWVLITLEYWPAPQLEPIIHPHTQASVIAAMGLDPVAMGGKVVDGEVFKPDANPNDRGPCAICGAPGMAIGGAGGMHLCAKHQDDY